MYIMSIFNQNDFLFLILKSTKVIIKYIIMYTT